jgi:starch synthase
VRILFVTSEVEPFSKTGGLGDVSAALPRHLHKRGHDVRVFVPFYSRTAGGTHEFSAVEGLKNLTLSVGNRKFSYSIVTSPLPDSGATVYFVNCPQLYGRPGIYSSDPDEHLRFLVLSRAALEAAQHLGFAPDIVHCNDWPTGMLPLILKVRYSWDKLFAATKTVLTIHNLNYQGTFSADILPDTGLADSVHLLHQDELRGGRISFLLTGIIYADVLTTVSPTYAREIQTPELGAGLDEHLRTRFDHLVGILNGVDPHWDPSTDPIIPARYSAADLAPKAENKRVLHESLGLRYHPRSPAIGIISRLVSQKGLDLALEVLPSLLTEHDATLVVLGNGDPQLAAGFTHLQQTFRERVVFYNGFQNRLAHWIEAGADMFLMPSRYEPCGLNQMYSLKYGTVPIVHRTGGLADTVELWNPSSGRGTGFAFEHFDRTGLTWALEHALKTYQDARSWERLMRNGMAQDFSWDRQSRRYEDLYSALTGHPRPVS